MSDIIAIKHALKTRALAVCEYLLPNGVLKGKREWCVGSIQGEPGDSLKVSVKGHKAGLWADFAESGEAGDLIDLWRLVRGLNLGPALDEIRDWLGMAAKEKTFYAKPKNTYRRPEKPACTVPKDVVREYLTKDRLLSDAALSAYKISQRGKDIVFPSLIDGVLHFVKYRPYDDKKGMRVEADCEPVLFGWQAIDPNAREITLCEGELDCPTLYDYGWPALSVPFGGGGGNKQRWIEAEFDRLQRFEVIYLALDNDEEGEAAVRTIVDRLGRERCRRVILPHKDANDCRKAGVSADVIRQCFESAKSMDPPELVRAGEFTDAVVNLFWPPDDTPQGYTLPFRSIGDKVRFRNAEMTLWAGATGSGKSQVVSHASVHWGREGARVCIASLEMKPERLLRRMVKQAGNVDRPSEPFIRAIMEWINEWVWCFNLVGKASTQAVLEVFDYAHRRYGCDTFIIDSLMRLGIASDDYVGQEKAVFEMVQWVTQREAHLHLVAHSRKSDPKNGNAVPESEDVKGASEIGSNAFNILSVFRDRKLEDKIKGLQERLNHASEIERRVAHEELTALDDQPPVILNTAKQRNGDWEGKCGLWFNQETYQYRSSQDDRFGIKYVAMPGSYGEHAA